MKRLVRLFPKHSVDVRPASRNGIEALAEYAMKQDTRVAGPWGDETVYLGEDILKQAELQPWQRGIESLYHSKPSKRVVYWFWDKPGMGGKTAVAKYMAWKYKVPCFTACKSWDILKMVSEQKNKKMYAGVALISFHEYQTHYYPDPEAPAF